MAFWCAQTITELFIQILAHAVQILILDTFKNPAIFTEFSEGNSAPREIQQGVNESALPDDTGGPTE